MLHFAARTWPWILARGIVAVLAGLITIVQPGIALATLAILIGIWLIADGVGLLINAFTIPLAGGGTRALLAVFGIVSVVAGGIALANMNAALSAIAVILAVWFFASGIAQIATAIRIRKAVTGEWMLIVVGVLGILCGVLTMFAPGATLATAAIMFGAFALVYGIAAIVAALRIRGLVKRSGA
ncbi:HdeD family acid-resistance protein [Propioniciclava coleopterorum]|uniref:HdeD family acid-resistance protein n=1 Tax=Propioniciclava coleopterorum TaxID=2714937 RepID=A0A6G7Y7A8_9ACTN|nr:DUF308 domain-containing protein [Propioniciclava coleopterorum]QIK72673.1 HdeD family acid-resistance protein [Propioniciclava coleopterorum]